MQRSAQQDRERASWMLELLRACISSDEVQALPIQEKRGKVIEGLRASLNYYRKIGKQSETWLCYELCLLVERSTTVKAALDSLKSRILAETAEVNQTPASNTGVRSPVHQALEDYIGGYNRG